MKLALISDIHGNLVSLNAVLADIARKEPDGIVCLGDVAATGPKPVECLERLMRLSCPVVMGNTDERFLTGGKARGKAGKKEVHMLENIDRWTATLLSESHLEFIRSFRPSINIDLGGGTSMLCYHGSPRSNTQLVTPATEEGRLREMFSDEYQLYAGGHTHSPMFRRFGTSLIINPGSVGLPFDTLPDGTAFNVPRGEYATVYAEKGHLQIEFCRVSIDVDAIIADALSSNMPHADTWVMDWKVP